MNDIEKIVCGALFGILVYVIGQLISKFFIEPLYELRKTFGEIRFNLLFHGPTINTPAARSKENSDIARDALLKNSSDLFSKLHAVPFYGVVPFISFRAFPSGKAIKDAAVQLRALSTYVHENGDSAVESLDEIRRRIAKIDRLLRYKSIDL